MTAAPPTAPEASAPEAETPRPAPRRRGLVRRVVGGIFRLVGVLLLLLLSVVTALLLFVLFPPPKVLHRAALPIAQKTLGMPGLALGGFDLDLGLRGRVELRDVYLPPPAGYDLPLFTAHRLSIRYDAREVRQGRVVIEEVQLERPVVRVEARGGKLNWLAFLESLSKGSKGPPPASAPASQPAPPAAPPKAPPAFTVELQRFAVIGLGAYVDDGKHRLVLDALDLAAIGRYAKGEAKADVRLRISAPKERSALALSVQEPQPLAAKLDSLVDLRLHLARLSPLAGRVDLGLRLRSRELKTRWKTPPLDLAFDLAAVADQGKDRARLERASLRFAGEELLELRAEVLGLVDAAKKGRLTLHLARLRLPLDTFARYAKAFVPGVRFGGTVTVSDVKLRSPVAALGKALPPSLEGKVALKEVWGEVDHLPPRTSASPPAAPAARFGKLSGKLLFRARGDAPGAAPSALLGALPTPGSAAFAEGSWLDPSKRAAPSLAALLDLRLDGAQVRRPGARLSKLRVRLGARAQLEGFAPKAFAARLDVGLGAARYRDPKLGPLSTSLRTSVAVRGDLGRRDVVLERLSLDVDRLLQARLRASARDFGKRGFEASLKLAPLSLARLLRKLPRPIRRKLPLTRLAGRLGLDVKARGRPPAPGTPPLSLPIHLDAKLRLRGLSATLGGRGAARGASLKGGELTLEAKGKPATMRLSSKLVIAGARVPAQGLRVGRVELPLAVRLSPRGVNARFALSVARLRQRASGIALDNEGLRIGGKASARLPLARLVAGKRLRIGRTKVDVDVGLRRARAGLPGLRARSEKLALGFSLDHDPRRRAKPSVVTFRGSLGEVVEERLRARAIGLAFDLRAALSRGLQVSLPLVLRPDELAGDSAMSFTAKRLRYPGVLPKDLRGVALTLDATLPPRGPLTLRRLGLDVPDYGATVRLRGKVFDARKVALDPRYLQKVGLPELRLALSAGIASKGRQTLVPGLSTRGRAGIKVELTRRGRDGLRVEGRLLARDFHLWQQAQAVRREDGRTRQYQRTLHVADLDANVPLVQTLQLRLGQTPPIRIPRPARSIFADASLGPAYRTLRPFTGRRGNFSLAGISLEDTLVEFADGARKTSTSRLAVGRTVLDLGIADSTLRLDQLYVKLFGGDIYGSVQAQLPALLAKGPLDARLRVDARLTNVDLAHLDPEARKAGREAKISSLVGVKVRWGRRDISGRVMLTDIAMKTLDSLLAFLDPHKLDESVQANRKLLTAWYTRLVNPRVKNVTVWLDHSRLNLDIKLGALWPFGALLKRVLKNLRIRRVSIKPFLPKVKKKEQRHAPRQRRARRRRGDGWLP